MKLSLMKLFKLKTFFSVENIILTFIGPGLNEQGDFFSLQCGTFFIRKINGVAVGAADVPSAKSR